MWLHLQLDSVLVFGFIEDLRRFGGISAISRLEAGENQFLKNHVARPGIEPRPSCPAIWNAKLTYIQIFVPIFKYLYLGTNHWTY